MVMNNAVLAGEAAFQALPSPAFNVGTGDFTVTGMITTSVGGPVVSRIAPGSAGFLLAVEPDGAIVFLTSDRTTTYRVRSGPTTVLDGGCHTITGVRQGTSQRIVFDGAPIPVTGSGDGTGPLNIDNQQPLLLGATAANRSVDRLVGTLMNVGFWNSALDGDRLVSGAFGRVRAEDQDLQGYWTLNLTTDDVSRNDNPANMVGPVRFQPCIDCVWAGGAAGYAFCQMANAPGTDQTRHSEPAASSAWWRSPHTSTRSATRARMRERT